MSKPTILVRGATGRTGAVVVAELLKAGYSVRALVRTADARSQALRARGVEIAIADMSDPESVAAALKDSFWSFPLCRCHSRDTHTCDRNTLKPEKMPVKSRRF